MSQDVIRIGNIESCAFRNELIHSLLKSKS